MLNSQISFLLLLSIFGICIILLGLFITYHNKQTMHKFTLFINDEYKKYKDELKNQNDILNKQRQYCIYYGVAFGLYCGIIY
jgi:uncharacterized BrkB/YihY/UPF0761 family membrane protein